MGNVGVKNKGLRKGFTLIELLISLVIFVIFMGVVASSFVSIVRAQKETNEIRKMYAEVRAFVDLVSEEARLGTIDYECYPAATQFKTNLQIQPSIQAQAYNQDVCPVQIDDAISADGRTSVLALVRKDGMQKTVFRYDSAAKTVKVVKYEAGSGGTWVLAPGYDANFSDAMGTLVKVDRLSFAINPDVNPYGGGQGVYSNNAKQFQPKVTLFMSVSGRKDTVTPLSIDFQTTISSRVYSRL